MEKAAVTSVCWVPRGKSNFRKTLKSTEDDAREAVSALVGGTNATGSTEAALGTAGLEEFNLDQYDDDDDGGMQFFTVLNGDGELAKEKDPYLDGSPYSDSEDDEAFEISPEDKVFTAVSCEEDICNLELYVFDEEEASMFVHHDVMLGAYPLCVDWLSKSSTEGDGSFAAIGLIDHTIQIWDLDERDAIEPCQMLGPKKKTKGKKARAPMQMMGEGPKAHDGPVLCLNSSNFNRSVLASGGADQTVKVWDVSNNSCVHVYHHHSDKVQCTRWHPTEQAVLLSAAFDGCLGLLDVRQPRQAAMAPLPAEAESAIWSRHRPFECIVSTDNGALSCYDIRKVVSKASEQEMMLWSMQAYDVACTSVQDSPQANILVTSGLDGYAKVWNAPGTQPKLVFEKNLQAGPLFTCQSSPEDTALFCFGGRCPVMWDLTGESLLQQVFKFEDSSA